MIWLIFDEMGAFQASGTDKKSKEIINEVMDRIKQIILLGRQAGVFFLVSSHFGFELFSVADSLKDKDSSPLAVTKKGLFYYETK